MQRNRLKTTHTQGIVAKVEWIPSGSPSFAYTGLYEDGTDLMLLRLSETTNLIESSTGLLPSLALKYLIAGRKSENLFGMPSFKVSDSWDFFAQDFSSRVDPFEKEVE